MYNIVSTLWTNSSSPDKIQIVVLTPRQQDGDGISKHLDPRLDVRKLREAAPLGLRPDETDSLPDMPSQSR